jgi:hypothetical protein
MLMRRPLAEAAVVVVVAAMGLLAACGDDVADPPPSSASAGEASQGGSSAGEAAEPAAGSDGKAGSPASTGGEGNLGGSPGEGGAASGDAGAPAGNAGAGAIPAEGGSGGVAGPPDLIVKTGGPWPDSLTGSCSSTSKLIPCPQFDDPLFGQDGSYRINVPSYTSTANTISDAVTALMWQLEPEVASKTQVGAVAYCDALSLAGHDDWRLPTRLEYVTLLDQGRPNGFAVPPGVPASSTGTQWTASATGRAADNFFTVQDEQGSINVAGAATPYTARCVRGPALTGTLSVGVDTVFDSMTNLEWQRTALEDEDRDWQEALAYCESLTHAAKSDWRLPSIKELLTIVDESALDAPVVDATSFGDSSAARYWSSTPARGSPSERFAFALETGFGLTPDVKMTEFAAARCVRTPD